MLRLCHPIGWLLAAALLAGCGGGSSGVTSGGGLPCAGITPPAKGTVAKASLSNPAHLPIKQEGILRQELIGHYPGGLGEQAHSGVNSTTKPVPGLAPRAGGSGSNACANLSLSGNGDGQPFTVSGTVTYQDYPVGPFGFSGSLDLPVVGATVELVSCATGSVLNLPPLVGLPDRTDIAGRYSISASSSTTEPAGVYVRVLAEAVMGDAQITVVDINPFGNTIYSVAHLAFDERQDNAFINHDLLAADCNLSDPNCDIDLNGIADQRAGAPFNILDATRRGIDFVRTHLPSAMPLLPPLMVTWEHGVTSGTLFFPTQNRINLTSQPNAFPADTDEYDDDVIMHEVGHYIASNISRDSSPGGSHLLGDNAQDARLSWSEGWGNFFAVAVSGNPVYRDTGGANGANGIFLDFNLETLVSPSQGLQIGGSGTTNELAVAGTLWDAFDSPTADGSEEPSDLGPIPLLIALASLNPQVDSSSEPVTLGRYVGRLYGAMQNNQEVDSFIQAALRQGVALAVDTGPSDLAGNDVAGGAKQLLTPTIGAPQVVQANLAFGTGKSSDQDHYAVTLSAGQSYTICTFGLGDGADTAIDLIPVGSTTPDFSNDNFDNRRYSKNCQVGCPANDATTLASTIGPIAPVNTQDYLIRVQRSPTPPGSAGLFGSYSLMVAANPLPPPAP